MVSSLVITFAHVAVAAAAASSEVVLSLPNGGFIGLSTRGASAFRVRVLNKKSMPAFYSPMIDSEQTDAPFTPLADGIESAFGSLKLSSDGRLTLMNAAKIAVFTSLPVNTASAKITLVQTTGKHQQKLFGRGGGDSAGTCNGANDASYLSTNFTVSPSVRNCVTYAPYYFSTAGYSCLGAVNATVLQPGKPTGGTNTLPLNYSLSSDGHAVTWMWGGEALARGLELYLMPAPTLDAGTSAYYSLVGAPVVPPRWAFGFILCRWGWSNQSYLEETLRKWRTGRYPADAFIMDFGWFTNVSDYNFPPQGFSYYQDFGYNPETLPSPKAQLTKYFDDWHFRMGGIRKPRLGNTQLLDEARSKGLLLPGGEGGEEDALYADKRNLNYANASTRKWYNEHMAHYLDEGVRFWWNDEGETDYYTFFWWSVAQKAGLHAHDPDARFFSISRAFSPGLARVGGAAWTGDIHATWDELRHTPGMVVNWGLAGLPYVACDIGGFSTPTNALLLTRWLQLGALIPIMRTHSTKSVTPHWPWLWGEPYADAMRKALELRYVLLPYHYSCAHAMHRERTLWMRPLVAEWPDDPNVAELTHEWLDGPSLLAAPIVHNDSSFSTYLPKALWYEFNSTAVHQGPVTLTGSAAPLQAIPIFVRAPAIVPLAPVLQHTGELPGGPLALQVYADADAGASFVMVEDDGETEAYHREANSAARTTTFSWDPATSTLSWAVAGDAPGGFVSMVVTLFRQGGAKIVAPAATIGRGGKIKLA